MRVGLASAALVVVLAACSGGDTTPATQATSTTSVARHQVDVVTLNVLHGLFCQPDATDWCKAPARLELVFRALEAAGCPELVGLQEVGPRQEELITARLPGLCEGSYRLSWAAQPGPDRGMILTSLPIVEEGFLDLASFPWEANWVRVRTRDGGLVDFLTTHFASSSNNPPCDATNCPPVCPAGIETNECHALEVVELLDRRAPEATMAIVAGDLNATRDETTVRHLVDAGFVDAWRAAGNPECAPPEKTGCTGAGAEPDAAFIGMDTVEGLAYTQRIDWVLVRPVPDCDLRVSASGFADQPADAPVDGMYWPSDHTGVRARVACG